MAKTELTQAIERYLENDYAPNTIGGVRVNKMRPSFVGLEVPVECGTIRSGLVDAVRVDECFLDEKRSRCCRLTQGSECSPWERYAQMVGCQVDKDSRLACQNLACPMMREKKVAEAGILITAFEIKVTAADFRSKHGHNFCGNCNFYVVPNDLYPTVKDLVPDDVGVLVFYDGTQTPQDKFSAPYYGVRKKKDCVYRPLTEQEQLWLLLSTMKRVVRGMRDRESERASVAGDSVLGFLPNVP